jgi:hypothetical protein
MMWRNAVSRTGEKGAPSAHFLDESEEMIFIELAAFRPSDSVLKREDSFRKLPNLVAM